VEETSPGPEEKWCYTLKRNEEERTIFETERNWDVRVGVQKIEKKTTIKGVRPRAKEKDKNRKPKKNTKRASLEWCEDTLR